MEYPFVRSVSGWIALGSPNFMSQLDHYAAYPALGAVRIDATEVSEDVFRKDSVRVGCSFLGRFGKRLDLRVQPALLVPTADFLAKIGDGPVAVTVCTVSGDKSADDEKLYALCRMQKMSNVTMKLVAPWEIKDSETDLWVKSILDMFGAERCMMGSGYMVGRETVSYEERRAGFDWFLDGCSESERVEVLGGTAARFYGLEAS